MKLLKLLVTTSCLSLLISGVASAEATPQEKVTSLSSKSSNQISDVLQKRSSIFNGHVSKKENLKGKQTDISISENDDSVTLVRLAEEVDHLNLANYSYEYKIINVDTSSKTTKVDVDLIQTFKWENTSKPSVTHDVVTFELKEESVGKVNFSKWNISSDDAVVKAKESISKDRKTLSEKPTVENITISPLSATNNIYDRNAAANYATTYGAHPNTNWYYFSESDCTDFASQVLLAGGILKTSSTLGSTNPDAWYYISSISPLYRPTNSNTWSVADNFFSMLRRNSVAKTTIGYSINDLDLGDIVTYDIGSDNNMNHNAALSSFSYVQDPDTLQWVRTAMVSYHSSDRSDVPWSYYSTFYQNQGTPVSVKYTHINFNQ